MRVVRWGEARYRVKYNGSTRKNCDKYGSSIANLGDTVMECHLIVQGRQNNLVNGAWKNGCQLQIWRDIKGMA